MLCPSSNAGVDEDNDALAQTLAPAVLLPSLSEYMSQKANCGECKRRCFCKRPCRRAAMAMPGKTLVCTFHGAMESRACRVGERIRSTRARGVHEDGGHGCHHEEDDDEAREPRAMLRGEFLSGLGPCTLVPVQAKRLHEEEHQQGRLGRFLQLVQPISLEDLLIRETKSHRPGRAAGKSWFGAWGAGRGNK